MSDATNHDSLEVADHASNEALEAAKYGSITKVQGLALLEKLVENDGFRALFESAPAIALMEIGVSAEQIATLRYGCLCSRTLAPRGELQAARKRLASDVDTSVLAFLIPDARI